MKLFQSQCYHKVPINMSTLTILLLLAALAAPVAAEQMTVTFGGVLLDLGATDFSGTYTGYYVFDTSTGIPSWDIVATFGRPLEIPGRPEAGLAQLVPGVGQQFEFTPMNSQSEYGTYVPPGINWARFTTTPDEYATLGYIRFEIDYESVINMNGIWLTEPFGDFWWAPPPGVLLLCGYRNRHSLVYCARA